MRALLREAMKGSWLLAAVLAAGMLAMTGCELDSSSSDSDGGGGGDFVGVWAQSEGSTYSGTPSWYTIINSDGTFSIAEGADGSGEHLSGTWTTDGGKLTGPFVNPGVGEGRIEATIADDVMQMDFIEYWHTPHKVVHYAGVKQ